MVDKYVEFRYTMVFKFRQTGFLYGTTVLAFLCLSDNIRWLINIMEFMMKCVKKSLFVTAGLAVMGLGLFFGSPSRVDAAVKDGKAFSDWVVKCTTSTDKKQICFLQQSLNSTKDDKQQLLAMYQVGYFGSGKTRSLKMIQTIPTDVSITPGTSIISSKKLVAPGKYVSCTKDSCQAIADISDNDLKTILSSGSNPIVGFMNSVGQQVNLPFSTKGLEEGLKALK